MIEYNSAEINILLKQYEMLSKSLKLIRDLSQRNDVGSQMTKIIEQIIEKTDVIYRKKYDKILNRSVYLMEDEKNRLSELINLIDERVAYVNNQRMSNREMTGMNAIIDDVLGEDKLDDFKNRVRIIEKYKNNIKMEAILKEEINSLNINIKKASKKIANNEFLNKRLEDNMISIVDNAINKLSLYELQEREKEIDLAYTELGYSLEKAKENAKIARNDYSEEIVLECDNMLASITLEFERYKEKKLILRLINMFKNPVNSFKELLQKREEINDILINIQGSELYSIIGNELNKEYTTIKLESQDIATLNSLKEEANNKTQQLELIEKENNDEELKGMLAHLLENEKKHQEMLEKERKKKEIIKQEELKKIEKKRQEELAKRQKLLEEERKKEIEERTKQLLVEKKNPVLQTSKENKENDVNKDKKVVNHTKVVEPQRSQTTVKSELFTRKATTTVNKKDDIFTKKHVTKKVEDDGIPVIKNNNLENDVISSTKKIKVDDKIFPDIPLEKKEDIFPEFPELDNDNGNSFFDEDEFNDLSNYMEDNDKKSWF